MGQYYMPANLDKKQWLYSHDFGSGLKLMEHSYIRNLFVRTAEIFLSPKGTWHKNRVIWAGDYGDKGLFIPQDHTIETEEEGKPITLKAQDINVWCYMHYKPCRQIQFPFKNVLKDVKMTWEDSRIIEERIILAWHKTLPKRGRFLVNHTKKVCIDLKAETGEGYWDDTKKCPMIIHPLPLLTCSGNGRGGGDYSGSNMKLVGCWAGDVISLEHKPLYTLNAPISFIEGEESNGNYRWVTKNS